MVWQRETNPAYAPFPQERKGLHELQAIPAEDVSTVCKDPTDDKSELERGTSAAKEELR